MPQIVHMPHPAVSGLPSLRADLMPRLRIPRRFRTFAALVASITVVLLAAAGIALRAIGRTPSQSGIDARLAAVRRDLTQKRAQRAHRAGEPTTAGAAARILGSEHGRRAQEAELRAAD